MTNLVTHNETLFLLPYRRKNNRFLGSSKTLFFLSFADAFRAIMQSKQIMGVTILAPDYYCPETLEVYKTYGRLKFYKTNDDLSINVASYLEAVKIYNPQIVINYGFLEQLSQNPSVFELLKTLPEMIIIEDCAHKIIREKDLKFAHRNHFYIDSVRKQTGILGSHLVFSSDFFGAEIFQRLNWYKIRSVRLKILQEVINILTYLSSSKKLYKKSEKMFEHIDSVIGTHNIPTLGGILSRFLWNHVDLEKILSHKKPLIKIYQTRLKNIKNKYFRVPGAIGDSLTYFPCLVSPVVQDRLVNYMESKNIWIGSLWDLPPMPPQELNFNLFETTIVLPLTWKTSKDDAERLCSEVERFFESEL